ncbi:hypothetical protein DDJ70_02140 [Klebsiella michiganensis]|uniref:Uncharacterized protein n=1 Tax=Klebsiella michiganensis TaxID=1134687 RepID=A0A2J4Y1N1_9ENTR|nr:hypothetical protein CWM85_37060 [Klebsiella michiganensis]RFC13376.1 hypothetical protein DDJ70_02140 [Klebsiella michiganensis]
MRRPREQSAVRHNFPEAMLRICPGYGMADGGEPVAPLSAARAGGHHNTLNPCVPSRFSCSTRPNSQDL